VTAPVPTSDASPSSRVLVAGLGNEFRRDDGVGPAVASQVGREIGPVVDAASFEDPLDLLGRWDGADLAVVVDALRSGSAPGTVCVLHLAAHGTDPFGTVDGPRGRAGSTHGIGLAGVLRLARALDAAPKAVAVVGIVGEDFERGPGLSASVAAAVPRAVGQVARLIDAHAHVRAGRRRQPDACA